MRYWREMQRCDTQPMVDNVSEGVKNILLAQPLNPFVRLEMRALPMWGSIVDQDRKATSAERSKVLS